MSVVKCTYLDSQRQKPNDAHWLTFITYMQKGIIKIINLFKVLSPQETRGLYPRCI